MVGLKTSFETTLKCISYQNGEGSEGIPSLLKAPKNLYLCSKTVLLSITSVFYSVDTLPLSLSV